MRIYALREGAAAAAAMSPDEYLFVDAWGSHQRYYWGDPETRAVYGILIDFELVTSHNK